MPLVVQKPWGFYTVLAENKQEAYLVKIITVFPSQQLSLQSHKLRSEKWICLSGWGSCLMDDLDNPKVLINRALIKGSDLNIPLGARHRLINCNDKANLEILEIQNGICDEDDIIRYEDDYGR